VAVKSFGNSAAATGWLSTWRAAKNPGGCLKLELAQSPLTKFPISTLERSRPAADAAREANGAVLLDGW